MDQNSTVVSLDSMHDIIIPHAISFWPLAPGWYALSLVVLAYGVHLTLKSWTRYRANAYRREALNELVSLVEKDNTLEMKRLLTLMKRVALQKFGRENVAALSDTLWWEFVEQHSEVKIETRLRYLVQDVLYGSDLVVSIDDIANMRAIAKVWIETHGALDD